MHEVVPFLPEHIFSLDICNLDANTENFDLDFYFYYLLHHAEDMYVCIETPENDLSNQTNRHGIDAGKVIGYMIGKTVPDTTKYKQIIRLSRNINYKTHVSALSVAPSHRSKQLGTLLMNILEENGNACKTWFCDLFVKVSNEKAIDFYKKRGYFVFRRIFGYYTLTNRLNNLYGDNFEEDAFDMRKALKRDEKEGFYSDFGGKDIMQKDMD